MSQFPKPYHLSKHFGALLFLLLCGHLEIFGFISHPDLEMVHHDLTEQVDAIADIPNFQLKLTDQKVVRLTGASGSVLLPNRFPLVATDHFREVVTSLKLQESISFELKVIQLQKFIYSIRYNIDPPETGKNAC